MKPYIFYFLTNFLGPTFILSDKFSKSYVNSLPYVYSGVYIEYLLPQRGQFVTLTWTKIDFFGPPTHLILLVIECFNGWKLKKWECSFRNYFASMSMPSKPKALLLKLIENQIGFKSVWKMSHIRTSQDKTSPCYIRQAKATL